MLSLNFQCFCWDQNINEVLNLQQIWNVGGKMPVYFDPFFPVVGNYV